MKKISLLLSLFFIISTTFSQIPKNAKSVNSITLLTEGKELHDQGRFTAAEKKYKDVPLGDSLYTVAQYELALTYYASEKYEEALQILRPILNLNDEMLEMANVYNLMGNTMSSLSKYDEAINLYDEALLYFPYNYLLVFNKGIVALKKKDYLQAAACFEESIFLQPSHQTSHFQLGVSYMNLGLTVQGILAINYAVFLNPKSNTAIYALQYLEDIYSGGINEIANETKVELPEKYKSEKLRFSKLENIVKANIYTQKDFKPLSLVKHAIVYQNQIIFENITSKANAKDVVNYLYIPYFQNIRSSKKDFDTYSIYLFSGTNIDNNKISKLAQKKMAVINEFLFSSVVFLKNSLSNGLGKENKEGFTYIYNDNFALNYFGKMIQSQDSDPIPNGEITFISSTGNVESKKGFKEGVNNGLNKFYHTDGTLAQEVPIENNQIHGKALVYHPNLYKTNKTMVKMEINYNRGVADGNLKRYNPAGFMTEHSIYAKDMLNGELKTFHPQGTLRRFGTLQDDEFTGWVYDFYPNGDTVEVTYYSEKGAEAEFKSYYPNGTIYSEGNLLNYNVVGTYKLYDSEGKLSFIRNYNKDGKKDGIFYDYFNNGNIYREYSYLNDKMNGDMHIYSEDGKKRYTEKYQNDEIVEVITYKPDGSIDKKISQTNKSIDYEIPSEHGFIETKISCKYGKKSMANYLHYWAHNAIYQDFSEVNKKKDGVGKTYYANGKLYSYFEYTDGNYNGVYLRYYPNDTLSEEGYYNNGKKYGAWYTYHPNGKIQNLVIHNKEGEVTHSKSYKYNGEIHLEKEFLQGWLHKISFFNEKGEVFKIDTFNYGNGIRRNYYYNGKPRFEVEMRAGKDFGKAKSFDFQGNIRENNGEYIEDDYYGEYKSYDSRGFLQYTTHYISDFRYGNTEYYYANGQIRLEYPSLDDEIHGKATSYYYNGKKSEEEHYEFDTKKDTAYFYAIDGTLAYQVRYYNAQIIAYSYRAQNGKMTDFIPAKEETTFTCYYANGKKSMEVSFSLGFLHGLQKSYYPNGTLHYEKSFYYGQLHGDFKEYFANGKPRLLMTCFHGDSEGECKMYHENGTLYIEEYYEGGYLHNSMNIYDNKGKIVKSQKYHYGSLLDEINY